MKNGPLPDQHHISRYCSPTRCTEDGQVTSAAFRLREGENALSVNWLEFLSSTDRDTQIQEIRKVLASKMNKIGANAKIAALNIGQMRDYVRTHSPDSRNLPVLHDPLVDDPSHSGIYNLREDDDLIATLIAEVVQETYSARA